MHKILGIDLGTKRIGLAISNIERNFAFPLETFEVSNISKDMGLVVEKIQGVVSKEGINEIVIGESKNFKNIDNPIMKHVNELKKRLIELNFKVILEPEFMTSEQAERHQGKNSQIDASAAAIILQSYLDRLAHQTRA